MQALSETSPKTRLTTLVNQNESPGLGGCGLCAHHGFVVARPNRTTNRTLSPIPPALPCDPCKCQQERAAYNTKHHPCCPRPPASYRLRRKECPHDLRMPWVQHVLAVPRAPHNINRWGAVMCPHTVETIVAINPCRKVRDDLLINAPTMPCRPETRHHRHCCIVPTVYGRLR